MRWKQLGEQVNCLIYCLAGQKYQGDIELTNRKVAEQIHYSEASLRAMRQGRFRPQDDNALVTLVEIGCREAGLNSAWAEALLRYGKHPDAQGILRTLDCSGSAETQPEVPPVLLPTSAWVIPRLVWMTGGTLLCLILWAYILSPQYPPPHEPTLYFECAWAALVGSGLAGGLLLADFQHAGKQNLLPALRASWPLIFIPAGGILGAVIWNTSLSLFFAMPQYPELQSGELETFIYSLTYSFWFSLPFFLITCWYRKQMITRRLVISWLFFTFLGGLLIVGGYALARLQPAFANQKDIDLLIGLLLRFVLIMGLAFLAPVQTFPKQFLEAAWWQPTHARSNLMG